MLFKYVRISVIVLLIVCAVFLLVNFLFKSSVNVVLAYEEFNPKTVQVRVAESILTPEGESANTYKRTLRPGAYFVEISGPDIETRKIEFTTGILENKEVVVDDINTLSAEEIAKEVYELDENSALKVFNAALFDDNTWLAFQTGDGVGNGALVVAGYSSEDLKWTIISDGTDVDFTSQKLSLAPTELVRYVRGL